MTTYWSTPKTGGHKGGNVARGMAHIETDDPWSDVVVNRDTDTIVNAQECKCSRCSGIPEDILGWWDHRRVGTVTQGKRTFFIWEDGQLEDAE